VGHSKGIDRITEGHIEHFSFQDGLVDAEMSATAIVEGSDGKMWFGTGRGLINYSPVLEQKDNISPSVLIEGVWVNNQKVGDFSQPLRLAQESDIIRIEFASPFFSDEVFFIYKLEGLGQGEPTKTEETSVSFHHLPGGTYQFSVQAITDGGIWSRKHALVSFSVTPPIWASRWLRGSLLLCLLLAFWLYGRIKALASRRESLAVLYRLKQEKLHSAQARRERAEDQHELSALDELLCGAFQDPSEATVLESLLSCAHKQFPRIKRSMIWLRKNNGEFRASAARGYPMTGLDELRLTGEEISHRYFYSGETWGDGIYFIVEAENLPQLGRFCQFASSGPMLVMSFLLESHIEAVIVCDTPEPFDPAEARKLKHFSHHGRAVLLHMLSVKKKGHLDLEISVTREALGRAQELLLHRKKHVTLGTLTSGIAMEFESANQLITNGCEQTRETLARLDDLVGKRPGMIESWQDLQNYCDLMAGKLNRIEDNATRISMLSARLASFCQLEDDEKPTLNLLETMTSVLIMVQDRFAFITLDLQIRDYHKYEVPQGVKKDMDRFPGEVAYALLNLVLNACEAIEKRRQLFGTETPAQLDIELFRQQDQVAIAISDTGVGIEEADRQLIFDPFFTTKPVNTGAGLGLYNVQHVLSRFGGHLDVVSKVGEGSTFTLFLPRDETPWSK